MKLSLGDASKLAESLNSHAKPASAGKPGAEFGECGKVEGLVAWRIENKVPVKVPDDAMGKLHKGDSYIFLRTSKSRSGAIQWAIHFWLGSESSQDEQGLAAYLTVELDESMGGGPVQYRECEGSESASRGDRVFFARASSASCIVFSRSEV